MNTTRNTTQELILKAAYRWGNEDGAATGPKAKAIAKGRLNAFAEVAADVLHICIAPAAFELAIIEALREHPLPRIYTVTRDEAQATRDAWEAEILAHVFNNLASMGGVQS